ncbi:hypothetical protein DSCO28_36490 [Desulfosarcina ovata subsp. sediminis]|uniref:DUF4384 domain-containing protein n=2 Tax=Desulfosarcina ovata TaxID=83564 RepID=A0A5K7ZS99_9BACT|nr:hypothetical protein DSCO28_36490 [Desulfosarcina ovata subsp. sediminis]
MNLYDAMAYLSVKLVESVNNQTKDHIISKIAVADFIGPDDRITGLGEYIADKTSIRLFDSGAFPDFMERKQLKQILQSRKTEMSGYFDRDSVVKFGKMIGVDSMVIGTVNNLESYYDVTAKIIQSETGRILGMADARLAKDGATEKLLSKSMFSTLTISVDPPVSGKASVNGITLSLSQGLATFTQIPYGECQIIIKPDGYSPMQSSIPIRSQFESFSQRLKAQSVDVAFQIIPPDAKLTVNGKNAPLNDQGFAEVRNLNCTECSYVIVAKGHKTRTGEFRPAIDKSMIINLETDDAFYHLGNKIFSTYKKVEKNKDFEIQLWSDKKSYRVGDSIAFYFKTDRDCYLTLINIGKTGNITQLFPNKIHPDNSVKAGVQYRIPGPNYGFEFIVEPPGGTERIYALASTSPIGIFDNQFNTQTFTSLTRGKTRDIGVYQAGQNLSSTKLESAAEYVVHSR